MLNKLAILIINYNKPEITQTLVNQLNYYDNNLFDLTVIDNSGDKNIGYEPAVIKWLLENKEKNYAGYWLLNNDIILDLNQDYISKFLEYINTDSEIAMISTIVTDDYDAEHSFQKMDLKEPQLVKYVDFHNVVITKTFLDKINFDKMYYFFGGLDFDLSILANKLNLKIIVDYRYSVFHKFSNQDFIPPTEEIRYHLKDKSLNIDLTRDFDYINRWLLINAVIVRYPELLDNPGKETVDKCAYLKNIMINSTPINYAEHEFNIGLSKYFYPNYENAKIHFMRAIIAGKFDCIGYLVGAANYTNNYNNITHILDKYVDRTAHDYIRSSYEFIKAQEHHFNIKHNLLKTYVFYVLPDAGHAWDPKHVDQGIGGSEIAVINLAKELAKVAINKVYVFNRCANPGIYDNVTWDHISNFDYFEQSNNIDILIVSRWPNFRFVNPKTQVYYWAHDLNYYERITPSNWQYFDKFLILSRYHYRFFSNAYPWIPKDRFDILFNGINLENYNQKIERNDKKLIYSSNPDRGLTILFDIFEELHKWDPELELHVFGYYPENVRKHPSNWKEMPGLVYRGYHKQHELAAEYMSSKLWLYPCTWLETFCITALEAQAAGTPCVVSEWAGLGERISNAGIVVKGFTKDQMHKQHFIESVKTLLTNKELWLQYSNAGKEQVIQQTWENSAQRLMEISNKCQY